MKRSTFYFLLVLAFLARLVLIPNPGFEADISFWKSWGLATLDHGIIKGLPLTNFNYPTPFAYVLASMVWVYRIFADPHNFNEFWNNANLLFLAIAKAFPILADFGIAGVFLYIGKHAKRLRFPELKPPNSGNHAFTGYSLLALVYLLSPLSLIDGALWGQVDSVGVFLFLVSCLLSLRRRPFWAGVVYMVAMMTKLQNMVYGPIFFLFVWQTMGLPGLTRAAGGALAAFAGLNIEFILARQSWRIIASITGNYDYFPWLSLNAYNPWWIFSGARGMEVSDKVMAIGMVNAKTMGLLAFSSFYVFAVLRQLPTVFSVIPGLTRNPSSSNTGSRLGGRDDNQKAETLKRFLESLIIVNAAFFLFQTQSHDRYAFPLSVFLLLWMPFYMATSDKRQEISNKIKLFTFHFSLFTVVYFYNLHTALIVNYPKNGIPFLNSLNTPTLTIVASFAHVVLFVVFLFALIRSSSRSTLYSLLFPLTLFIAALFTLNFSLFTKSPVSLTKITPISSSAGYASRQINMPAVASFGFDKWSPLSVQYAFYKTGIGTHAPARDVYDINRKFKTFSTDYGVDTVGGPQGSVIFEVYGDDTRLFQSDVVKRFDLPRHAEVDIAGVKMLELVVTDGGNGNTDDHADWLNPYLIPK